MGRAGGTCDAEARARRLANTEAQLEIVLTDFANSLEVQESLTHEARLVCVLRSQLTAAAHAHRT